MTYRVFSFFLFIFILGIRGIGYGQPSHDDENTQFIDHFEWVESGKAGIHEINIIGGYSFHSTRGFWGKTPGATLSLFALRYNRKLLTFYDRHLIEYVVELNLAADYQLHENLQDKFTGVGITPIGFQFNMWKENSIQPFFKSSAGFMHLSKPFPDERGVRFNFTLELGLGLEFIVAEDLSFTMGYKYHHMSNGQFGQINPGVDSNIFYSGFTFF